MGRSHEKILECSPHRSWRDDPASVGICKFYLRGTCTWGIDCKYLHMKEVSNITEVNLLFQYIHAHEPLQIEH